MFKFKSKFIIATLVVFGVLASINGCNKDELIENKETNSESVVDTYSNYANQAAEQYISNSSKLSWQDWIRIGIADAFGAIEGAKKPIPFLPPPWNKIGGAIVGGATASYIEYLILTSPPALPQPLPLPQPYPLPLPLPYPFPFPWSNPFNPLDMAGVCHNLALWECVNTNIPNDLNAIYNGITAEIYDITYNNITTNEIYMILPIGEYLSFYTLNNPYPLPTYEENELFTYLINFTDPVEANILANYFYNMFLIGDLQGCTAYSISMEDYITSLTLNPDNEENILIAMAVFRNSINFWN